MGAPQPGAWSKGGKPNAANCEMPPTAQTFKQAPKAESAKPAQPDLGLAM